MWEERNNEKRKHPSKTENEGYAIPVAAKSPSSPIFVLFIPVRSMRSNPDKTRCFLIYVRNLDVCLFDIEIFLFLKNIHLQEALGVASDTLLTNV